MEGENYFLRMAYGEELQEEEKTWKLMSCEMIDMEVAILKCSKMCILPSSPGFWKIRLSKKKKKRTELSFNIVYPLAFYLFVFFSFILFLGKACQFESMNKCCGPIMCNAQKWKTDE